MRLIKKKKSGLTLLETIFSIGIIALVVSASLYSFGRAITTYRILADKNQAALQVSSALEWLVRDINSAYSIARQENTADDIFLGLIDPESNYILYHYNRNSQRITRQLCGDNFLLAENISNFSLRYYDIANQEITNPVNNASNLRTIEIELTARKNNQEFTLNTIARFNFNPDCQWARLWAGEGDERLNDIRVLSDGYIAGGYISLTPGGNFDFLVLRTDLAGNVGQPPHTWAKRFANPVGGNDILFSLQRTADGGFILGGSSEENPGSGNSNFLVIRLDRNGELVNNFGPAGAGGQNGTGVFGFDGFDDQLSFLQQTQSGGYILGGTTNVLIEGVGGGHKILLIKLNENGQLDTNFGIDHRGIAIYTNNLSEMFLHSLQQTSDGGYILVGRIEEGGGTGDFTDFLAIKIDSTGNIQWAKRYGRTTPGLEGPSYRETIYSVLQTNDGGFIFAGETAWSPHDLLIVRVDAKGDFNTDFGPRHSGRAQYYNDWYRDASIFSIQQTNDGGFIFGGATRQFDCMHAQIMRSNPQGLIGQEFPGTWYTGIRDYKSVEDTLFSIQLTQDGGFIAAGSAKYGTCESGNEDALLIKANSLGRIGCSGIEDHYNEVCDDEPCLRIFDPGDLAPFECTDIIADIITIPTQSLTVNQPMQNLVVEDVSNRLSTRPFSRRW